MIGTRDVQRGLKRLVAIITVAWMVLEMLQAALAAYGAIRLFMA